jgi:hypothetical protein
MLGRDYTVDLAFTNRRLAGKKGKREVKGQRKPEDLRLALTRDLVRTGSLACWQPGRKSSISRQALWSIS